MRRNVSISPESLRDRALLALEEVVHELRFQPGRRTFALRFALAFLWAYRPTDRTPYVEFWQALTDDSLWRFSVADRALEQIYRATGATRDDEVMFAMWRRAHSCLSTASGGDAQASHVDRVGAKCNASDPRTDQDALSSTPNAS